MQKQLLSHAWCIPHSIFTARAKAQVCTVLIHQLTGTEDAEHTEGPGMA